MGICDEVRAHCAQIANTARHVQINHDALDALTLDDAPAPELDPEIHFHDGTPEQVAAYHLCVDAINFGSGWFPTLRKREGQSGYTLMASALTNKWQHDGGWRPEQLRHVETVEIAELLGQDRDHELMSLYAQALRALGRWLGERSVLGTIGSSAEQFTQSLANGMAMFNDAGFYKRAQITAADLALAKVAQFDDLHKLTIFADNVVPHVLRCDGVLEYEDELAAVIDSEQLLPPGPREREIRACALHACESIAQRLDIEPRTLDNILWTRGRAPQYKSRPRHRTRCVFY